MKNLKKMLSSKTYDKIWKDSHDVIETSRTLDELYSNVPDKLKNESVSILEIHCFDENKKDEIIRWLDDDK